ncbi:hypothetical protein ACFZCP_16560 [Streptomyces sp. NPDC007971]|uniref:hypothetical protein n=1 Tax=Streptomyces sp. NPDC007971 TaxID=3364799 RepID=UPI0036EBB9FE
MSGREVQLLSVRSEAEGQDRPVPDGQLRGRRTGAAASHTSVAALLPVTRDLHTPGSRPDDVTAVAAAVRAAGRDADGVLYLPGRRRVWSLADPGCGRRGRSPRPSAPGSQCAEERGA